MQEHRDCFETFGCMLTGDPRELLALEPALLSRKVREAGAVVLRSPELGVQDFVHLSGRCSTSFSDYAGGGFQGGPLHRERIDENPTLLTVSGRTQAFGVPLHGECYYQRERPEFLWFYCDVPPEAGGQTTFARATEVYAALPAELQAYFRQLGLAYLRHFQAEEWAVALGTKDRAALHAFCERNGMALELLEDDACRTRFAAEALCESAAGPMFINSLLILWWGEYAVQHGEAERLIGKGRPMPLVVRDAHEQPISADIVRCVSECAERVTREHRWQRGDIAIVDNRSTLHGRRRPRGGTRNILVRLATGTR